MISTVEGHKEQVIIAQLQITVVLYKAGKPPSQATGPGPPVRRVQRDRFERFDLFNIWNRRSYWAGASAVACFEFCFIAKAQASASFSSDDISVVAPRGHLRIEYGTCNFELRLRRMQSSRALQIMYRFGGFSSERSSDVHLKDTDTEAAAAPAKYEIHGSSGCVFHIVLLGGPQADTKS